MANKYIVTLINIKNWYNVLLCQFFFVYLQKRKHKKMNKEEKELLLKGLSERVPYGVCVEIDSKSVDGKRHTVKLCEVNASEILKNIETLNVKPILRPMSSMAEEEKLHVELRYGFFYHDGVLDNVHIFEAGGTYDRDGNYDPPCEYRELRHVTIEQVLDFIHWLNAHHFDYRTIYDEDKKKYMSMIERGLAIEVTENNNPYKK